MTVIVGLLIGNETWQLHERSLRSLRYHHPDQTIVTYYSLGDGVAEILKSLQNLNVEAIDIGRPGLLNLLPPSQYSDYNTLEFNIKTSFKWLAVLGAMTTKLDNVIFIDSDIKLVSPLPLQILSDIWKYFDIFIQDEGNSIFPKHPCTGFVGFKFGERNISLLELLHKEQTSSIVSADSQHDQSIFAGLLSRDIELYQRVYFLPQSSFPVGYMAPIYRNYRPSHILFRGQDDPIIYHANWTVGVQNKAVLMDAFSNASSHALSSQSHEDIIYCIGQFSVILPYDHLLPEYQRIHPKYDRFLPHLARFLTEGSTVIDIGANCGHTLAAMASSNLTLSFICIEADAFFHSYLEKNARTIRHSFSSCQITIICELVGLEVRSASLTGSGGTKTAISLSGLEGDLQSKELDEIYFHRFGGDNVISLLKVDTDGYDYDVLRSASHLIETHQPLLFFECQYSDSIQLEGYLKLLDWLADLGYNDWYLFDNFGGYLMSLTSIQSVIQIIEYIRQQNQHRATRTFYYLDILAATPGHHDLAAKAIQEYQSLNDQ